MLVSNWDDPDKLFIAEGNNGLLSKGFSFAELLSVGSSV